MMRRAGAVAVLAVAFITLVSVGVFASGAKETASAGTAQPIHLKVWVSALVSPEEQKLSQDQWYMTKAVARFAAQNPGIVVDFTFRPGGQDVTQLFKAAALAGNGPDIVNLYSGAEMFAVQDIIQPLDNLVPAADLKAITGWDSVRAGFDPKGTILGYPILGPEETFFFYNKALVAKAGLDFENDPPRTTQEFDAALAKIKATGAVPIATDESVGDEGEGLPWLQLTAGYYWWVQLSGPTRIRNNSLGKSKFAEDAGLITAGRYYASLFANGYVNQDTASSSDSIQNFINGKAALLPEGNWQVVPLEKAMGDNLGVIRPPDISSSASIRNGLIGGAGQALALAKYSKYPKEGVKFMSFIDSKPEVLEQEKIQSRIPIRADITPAELGWTGKPIFEKMLKWSPNIVYWVDNIMAAAVTNDAYKTSVLVLTGKNTPEDWAKHLDGVASQNQ